MEFIDNTFINIYDKENPPLNVGDMCYFLFSNVYDVHVLLIGAGVVVSDKIEQGIHKTYKIKLMDVCDDPIIMRNFIFGKQFYLTPINGNEKLTYIHESSGAEFFNTNLFKIDCFFVRPTLQSIKELREYCNTIKIEHLNKQISDIENLRI